MSGEVKKNVEQHVVQFRDIVKEQSKEEMQSRVDDSVRKKLLNQVSGELKMMSKKQYRKVKYMLRCYVWRGLSRMTSSCEDVI